MSKIKTFYDRDLDIALKKCQEEGYRALFMPEVVDQRLNDKAEWNTIYSTLSIKAVGRTRQGSAVVVYAHIPNYYSNPNNIKKVRALRRFDEGLIPQEELQKLVDAEDNKKVFVFDFNKLKNKPLVFVTLDSILENPQTKAVFGSQERAEKYLAKHKQVLGDYVTVCDNNYLRDQPFGALLNLGNEYLIYGSEIYYSHGRFLGEKNKRAKNEKKINEKS